jgi:hypothetical protein
VYDKYYEDDGSSSLFNFQVEECATISRAWLWRVHFLKVIFHKLFGVLISTFHEYISQDCDSSASLIHAFRIAQVHN